MTSPGVSRRRLLSFGAIALLGCRRVAGSSAERIVSAGAAVTETLFALGAGSRVVGVDSSSAQRSEGARITEVGYVRQLSAEGVLSLAPTLLLASHEAGPPATLARLRESGVTVVVLPEARTRPSAIERVRLIGAATARVPEATQLIARMNRALDAARPVRGARRRVLFVYARGAGTLNVAGAQTAADAMISLAGAANAVTGYEGYRPLTAEALVRAQPDVLLFTERGLQSVGGVEGAARLPGVALCNAGRTRAVIAMDDALLLSFGPRIGEAVDALARLIERSPTSVT
jgi:iron complex transport system substrate-binding protein